MFWHQVYKQVCASCHGCFTVNFRMMGNVCMTMEEAKAEARRATVRHIKREIYVVKFIKKKAFLLNKNHNKFINSWLELSALR